MKFPELTGHERLYASLLITNVVNLYLVKEVNRKTKQVAFLSQIINRQGGIQDEFDRIACRELGLTLLSEKPETPGE